MKKETEKLKLAVLLRKNVEDLLKNNMSSPDLQLTVAEIFQLITNIEVQQDELEKQNKKLKLAKTNFEISPKHINDPSFTIEKLRKSEEKFETIFDNDRDSITIFRINDDGKPGNYIEANKATTEIFGYTKKELLSLSVYDLEIVSNKTRSERLKSLKLQGRIDFETSIKTKKGKYLDVEVQVVLINYLNEPAVMNVTRDITERKQLESNVKKAYENLSTILEAIPDLLFEVGLSGRIYHYQSHSNDLLAVPPEMFMGKLLNEILPAEASNVILEALNEANEKNWSIGKQYSLELPNGKFWFELSVSAINNSDDKDKHFIALARNITDRKLAEIALKDSENFLKQTQVIAKLGSYTLEIKTGKWTSSEVLDSIFGIDDYNFEKSIEGWTSTIHPEWRQIMMDYFTNEVLGKKKNFDKEYKIIRQNDKEERWVYGNGELVFNDKNELIKMIGTIQDITERKDKFEELEKLNRVLSLNNQINNLILRTHNREILFQEVCKIAVNYGKFRMSWIGLLNDANNEISPITWDGFEEGYLNKMKKTTINDVPEGKGPVGSAMREGKIFVCNDVANDPIMEPWRKEALQREYNSLISLPIVVRGKTTAVFNLYSHEINFFINEEEIKLLRKITENIAFSLETILVEEERKQAEERFRDLVDSTGGIVWEADASTFIFNYVSKQAERLLGYSPEDWYTPGFWAAHIHSDDRKQTIESCYARTKQKLDHDFTYRFISKDGQIVWLKDVVNVILEDGKPKWLRGVMLDITDRKKIEQQLINAKDKAEESDHLKSAFLANMSHEIRTPMNGILGFTKLLKEPKLSGEDQQEYIKIIEKSGNRMLNIINDIISISKVESGQMEVSLSDTNVNEQIKYLHNFFKHEANKRGLELSYTTTLINKETNIKTDKEKLYAILTNLVKNAIKFTDAGSIAFGYTKKEDFLEFYVKDTGNGIPENQKKIIFERFRQVHESVSRNFEGSGLGLTISKAYVELLGGKIWVESEEGKGSTFYFTIPFIPAEKEVEEEEIVIDTSYYKTDAPLRKLKVLIVEDDSISKLLITIAIKNFANEILSASTGLEAIEACLNNPDIDLVMMDINMPEMDGYEATSEIREFNKDIVIIAQTANAFASDREQAIAAGCNDYISKPVNLTELKSLIEKYF